MRASRVFSLVFSFALIGLGFWAVSNQQYLFDQYIITTKPLSQKAAMLAGQVKFTTRGKALFASAQPSVESAKVFNSHCAKKEIKTVVLGCYIGPQHIYIYDVNDARLKGVKPVTAAHETLHAAYARLSSVQRKKVDAMLEKALPVVLKRDTALSDQLQIYARTEPGQRDNELHSILGTESADLPSDLENYYKKYFTDRTIITNFAAGYTKVFSTIKNNQDNLASQLKALNTQISSMVNNYNARQRDLNDDIQSFNQRANQSGGFASESEFNTVKADLMTRQNELKTDRTSINQAIAQYELKRSQLEALNVQVADLNAKLDSASVPSL